MPSPKGPRLSRRILKLRQQIAVPFLIRGHKRGKSFSTQKGKKFDWQFGEPFPAYFIPPLQKMTSKKWITRLHATLHAAISRAMRYWVYDSSLENFSSIKDEKMPTITVIISNPLGDKSAKQAFIHGRMGTRIGNPRLKMVKYGSRLGRKMFQQASVHGKKAPTFIESTISWSGHGNKLVLHDRKAFEIRLTRKELSQAIRNVEERLHKKGMSIDSMNSEYKNARTLADEMRIWENAVWVAGHSKWTLTKEATPKDPVNYLVYQEVARIMTNKFVRRGLKWLENNLGKEGVKLAIQPKH